MNKKEVLQKINSNIELLSRIKTMLYHGKTYVLYDGSRIDKIYKTKRGAAGYIKKNKDFSYYDDYIKDLVYPNKSLEIIEILENEIADPVNNKMLWQDYIRKHMSDITIHHLEDNIIHIAKDAGVTDELMTYIQSKIKEIKETNGMTIDQFPGQTEKKKKDEQINSTSIDTKNASIEANSSIANITDIQVSYNKEMNGIELVFANKPDMEVLVQLKTNGFRWSRRKKIWYTKDTPERRDFIKNILQAKNNKIDKSTITEINTQTQQPKQVEYPEINIDDIGNYTVPDDISKRENDNSMFRSKDIDHTKELQKVLQSANDDVIELCNTHGCNNYIKYRVRTYLQSFKRKYTDAYIAVLRHKVNNPSWYITGRGNLNSSKYNKKQEQYDNKLQYTNRLIDKFTFKMQQYRNKINSINNKKEFNQYLHDIKNIDLAKEKFERTKIKINRGTVNNIFYNANYEMTAYEYKGYYILKNYSRFNIYDSTGQEIEQKYTDGTLRDAKINLIYYLSNLAVTEQVI